MRRQREPVRLTKRTIDAFVCPPGSKDALLFDAELRGFAIRATSAGRKIFLLQYKRAGKVMRVTLGEYGVITAEKARTLAEQERGRVSAGEDPRETRREAERARAEARRAAEADAFSFDAMAKRWHKEHVEPNRSPAYAHEALRALRVSFAAWKDRAARSITSEDASAELDDIRAERGPAAALHAFRYAHAAYAWAERRKLVPANPLAGAVQPEPLKSRDRALTDAELGAVWRCTAELGPPFAGYFQMLILTLQRRGEVAGMRWDEISDDLRIWTLPSARTKNAQRHMVHLAPAARAVIAAQPRHAKSPYVFTSTGKAPVSGFSKAKASLDAQVKKERQKERVKPAAMPAWHAHDLRRTGASTLARLGVLPDVADRLLNHQASSTNSGVMAVYQVHDFAAERELALRKWAEHVLKVAAKPAPGAVPVQRDGGSKVVQLRQWRRAE